MCWSGAGRRYYLRRLLKVKWYIFILFFCIGCRTYSGLKPREFYGELDGNKQLTLHVPKRYVSEQIKLDYRKGIEQFYTYPGGSLFYVSYKADWASPNTGNLKNAAGERASSTEIMYNGVDKSKLYWKEIIVDSLRFGYCNVPLSQKYRFEQAINSMQVKRKPFWKNQY
ncbi:MAG: hypothetical protein JWP69_586 [Flaviaesturariibacter sp.]|nr:hypothetical protein [Flaviaesturariibacter sp.]